jgi:hypothetical protein
MASACRCQHSSSVRLGSTVHAQVHVRTVVWWVRCVKRVCKAGEGEPSFASSDHPSVVVLDHMSASIPASASAYVSTSAPICGVIIFTSRCD